MHTILLAVDVQRVFHQPTDWHVPDLDRILPQIRRLAAAFGADAIYSRHVAPADGGQGTWHPYYRRWAHVGREPGIWNLVDGLAHPGAGIVDKTVYSCFGSPALQRELARRGHPSLVVCGVETDVCVLATVMDAVDQGIPVTVVTDAVTSADLTAHAGVLALYRRLEGQIACRTTDQVLAELRR